MHAFTVTIEHFSDFALQTAPATPHEPSHTQTSQDNSSEGKHAVEAFVFWIYIRTPQ